MEGSSVVGVPTPTIPAGESKTPYTDATKTRKQKPGHVKRPMNAFMVFSHAERKNVKGTVNHSDISKILGQRWKALSESERAPFIQKAMKLKEDHQKEFPNYKYQPKKKDNKGAADKAAATKAAAAAAKAAAKKAAAVTAIRKTGGGRRNGVKDMKQAQVDLHHPNTAIAYRAQQQLEKAHHGSIPAPVQEINQQNAPLTSLLKQQPQQVLLQQQPQQLEQPQQLQVLLPQQPVPQLILEQQHSPAHSFSSSSVTSLQSADQLILEQQHSPAHSFTSSSVASIQSADQLILEQQPSPAYSFTSSTDESLQSANHIIVEQQPNLVAELFPEDRLQTAVVVQDLHHPQPPSTPPPVSRKSRRPVSPWMLRTPPPAGPAPPEQIFASPVRDEGGDEDDMMYQITRDLGFAKEENRVENNDDWVQSDNDRQLQERLGSLPGTSAAAAATDTPQQSAAARANAAGGSSSGLVLPSSSRTVWDTLGISDEFRDEFLQMSSDNPTQSSLFNHYSCISEYLFSPAPSGE